MSKKLLAIVLSVMLCFSIFAIPAAAHGQDGRGEKVTIELAFKFCDAEKDGYNYYMYLNEPDTVYFDFDGRSYDFDDVENDFNAHTYKNSLENEKKNGGGFFNSKNIVIGDNATYLGNNMFADYFDVENIYVPDSVTEIGEKVFPSETDAIIHCGKGSPAIKGALEAGLRFDTNGEIGKADLNGDGKVNLLDLIVLRKAIIKWHVGYEVNSIDVNGDGKVNLLDLILLRKYLAKWIDAIIKIEGRPETPDVIETPDFCETPSDFPKPISPQKPTRPERPEKPEKPEKPHGDCKPVEPIKPERPIKPEDGEEHEDNDKPEFEFPSDIDWKDFFDGWFK